MDWLAQWWVWAAAAVVFAILEVLIPAFIFLGFTIGGAAMALLVGVGLVPTTAWGAVIFAALSLAGYVVLRLALGNPREQVRIITRDINDN